MAGDVLMCVWETAWALKGRGVTMAKDTIEKILNGCNTGGLMDYTVKGFQDAFPDDKIQFSDFKRYAALTLRPPAVTMTQFEEHMERCCLNQALSGSGYKDVIAGQNQFEEIWRIFVRLAHADSYPPVVSRDNITWVLTKFGGQDDSIPENNNQISDIQMTFKEFLQFIRKLSDPQIIENIYSAVVRESIHVQYLPCREKQSVGWSLWKKYKLAMCYGKLELYDQKNIDKPAKVYYVECKSISTKIKTGTFSVSKKLNNRLELFLRRNDAKVIIQIAFDTADELEEWRKYFQINVRAMASGNKPMIQQIMERPVDPEVGKRKSPCYTKPKQEENRVVMNNTEIEEKIRTIFLGIDKDGNGLMDSQEFKTLMYALDIDMDDEQLDLVFGIIDMDGSDFVTFEEFFRYMMHIVGFNIARVQNGDVDDDMHIIKAFRKADNDTRGVLDFKEFIEFMISADQLEKLPSAVGMFQECDCDGNGCLEYEQFRDIFLQLGIDKREMVTQKERKAQLMLKEGLRKVCHSADTSTMAAFLEARWKKFSGLKRYDKDDNLLMEGGDLVKDLLPGTYKLSELSFFDPPKVLPKHIVAVDGVKWRSKNAGEKSGELTFMGNFDGVVPTTLATCENLSYYNCTLAGQSDRDYSIVFRHGVIDFDYSKKYLEEYVMKGMGGSGIEQHGFDHLDCPLDEDSGVMVIGKFVNEDTLHLTGFIVPKLHTVFIPANAIHSNDYLRGTWRTMLSDEGDIDHVQFVRYENGKKQHFHFTFSED